MNQQLENFVLSCIPPTKDPNASYRRSHMKSFLESFLPSEVLEYNVEYNFHEVMSDGDCFFHTVIKFFSLIGIVNFTYNGKKLEEILNEDQQIEYVNILTTIKELCINSCKEFIGETNFSLDNQLPEYELLCKCLADYYNLHVIVINYDFFRIENNSEKLNRIYSFKPADTNVQDCMFAIVNASHFTLIQPELVDKNINQTSDQSSFRLFIADHIIEKAKEIGIFF